MVCCACGTHLAGDADPPAVCPICADQRQYVPAATGQRWLRHGELARSHRTRVELVEPDLWGVGVEPKFAIGQRALLVCTSEGNVLWDCVPLCDQSGVELVRALGGAHTIAVSHPHFYGAIVPWAEALDAEVLLHAADREHVHRPSERIRFWEGERLGLPGGLTLVRAGGHFAGGTVLHWPAGADGRGALLAGDILQVIPDRMYVGFMWSYPNLVPLPLREVQRVAASLEGLEYERIVGGWWDRIIHRDGPAVVRRSVERYERALQRRLDGETLPDLAR
jgi:hypothetical protein